MSLSESAFHPQTELSVCCRSTYPGNSTWHWHLARGGDPAGRVAVVTVAATQTRPPHYFVSKQGPVPHAAARTRPPLQFPAPYCRPTTHCSAAVLQGVIPSVNKDPCSTCRVPAQCGTHPNILHFHRREEGKLLFIFKNECLLSSVLHFHKMYIYLYKCVLVGSGPTLFIVQIIISSYMLFLWIPRNTFLHFMHYKIPLFTWQFPRSTDLSVLEQESSFLDAGVSTHSTSPTSE